MKKNLALLFVIISIFFIFSVDINREVIPVFNESEETPNEVFSIYKLNVHDSNITTFNLKEFLNFKAKDIVIIPSIAEIHKKKIGTISYRFISDDIDQNINRFHRIMSDLYQKNAFVSEALKINIRGIKLDQINLYASSLDINKLLIKYPEIKIVE